MTTQLPQISDPFKSHDSQSDRLAVQLSKRRQENLHSYMRLHTTDTHTTQSQPTLFVVSDIPTAAVHLPTGSDTQITQQPTVGKPSTTNASQSPSPTILIPAKERNYEGCEITVSPMVADRLIQYAETLHEVGHILYTDAPALQRNRENAAVPDSSFVTELANVLEDGAIEEFLRQENSHKVDQRLSFKNHIKFSQRSFGQLLQEQAGWTGSQSDSPVTLSVPFALTLAAFDLAKYNTGRLHYLLCEICDDPSKLPDALQPLPTDTLTDSQLTQTDDVQVGLCFSTVEHRQVFYDCLEILTPGIIQVKQCHDGSQRAKQIWDILTQIHNTLSQSTDANSQLAQRETAPDTGQQSEQNSQYGAQQGSPPSQSSSQQIAQQQQAVVTGNSPRSHSQDDPHSESSARQQKHASSSQQETQQNQAPNPSSGDPSTGNEPNAHQANPPEDDTETTDSSTSSTDPTGDTDDTDSSSRGSSPSNSSQQSVQSKSHQSKEASTGTSSSQSSPQSESPPQSKSQPQSQSLTQQSPTSLGEQQTITAFTDPGRAAPDDSQSSSPQSEPTQAEEQQPDSPDADGPTDQSTDDSHGSESDPGAHQSESAQEESQPPARAESTDADSSQSSQSQPKSASSETHQPESPGTDQSTDGSHGSESDSESQSGSPRESQPTASTQQESHPHDDQADSPAASSAEHASRLSTPSFDPAQSAGKVPEHMQASERRQVTTERQSAAATERKITEEKTRLKRVVETLSQQEQPEQSSGGSGASSGDNPFDIDLSVRPETDTSFSPETVTTAQSLAKTLVHPLEQSLDQTQQQGFQHGRRSGKPDPKRLATTAVGNTRACRRRTDPTEPEYDVVLILDRSGSMRGDLIQQAEIALGAYAYALEELGVSISIIDLYDNDPRVILPFQTSLESHQTALFTGEASGGTPLHKPLAVADQRLAQSPDYPFIICVTDGKPSPEDAYIDTLESTYAPVIGITLEFDSRSSTTDHTKYYHLHRPVDTPPELVTELYSLAAEFIIE